VYSVKPPVFISVSLTILGVNMIKRKLAAKISPTLEIEFDGTTFTQKTLTSVKNSSMTCKLGEEYDHTFEEAGITKKVRR